MSNTAKKSFDEVTLRESAFIDEYLIDFNGARAAKAIGCPERTARQQAVNILKRKRVQDEITRRGARLIDKCEVTTERVIKELALIAFANIKGVASWTETAVRLKASEELTDDQSAAVESVKMTKDGLQIKMHDKKGALDTLGKYLGIFVEKTDSTVTMKGDGKPVLRLFLNGTEVKVDSEPVEPIEPKAEEAPKAE